MVIALAQIGCERLPSRVAKLKINIGLDEDVLHDQRISIAVRHHRANVAVKTEGIENRFVERKIAVLRPRQRAVDIEKKQPFHAQTDICTIRIALAIERRWLIRYIDNPDLSR